MSSPLPLYSYTAYHSARDRLQVVESDPPRERRIVPKPVLLSLHGLPRSGKSTLTGKLRRYYGASVVNADAVRLALHGQRYLALAEPMVFAIRQIMVRALFGAGHQIVIYDDTNYSRAARDKMRSDEWDTYYIEVDTPPEICKERAVATGQPDLIPVIDAMWARREPLEADEPRWQLPAEFACLGAWTHDFR